MHEKEGFFEMLLERKEQLERTALNKRSPMENCLEMITLVSIGMT